MSFEVVEVLRAGPECSSFKVATPDGFAVRKELRASADPNRRYRDHAAFRNEIAVLRALGDANCPGVAELLDAAPDVEHPWYLTPFYPGGTMARHSKKTGSAWLEPYAGDVRRVVSIVRDLAVTLGWAHLAGVSHGDVTAGNIVFARPGGRPVLIDFWMASLGPDDGHSRRRQDLLQLGRVAYAALVGSPRYIDPPGRGPGAFELAAHASHPRLDAVDALLGQLYGFDGPTPSADAIATLANEILDGGS
jgi:serine/threonine protein kinase